MRQYTIIVAVRPSDAEDAEIPGYEFLMMRNRKRGDKYELPGGTVEPREEPLVGARREFVEETGHDCVDPALVQRRAGALGEGFVYVCRLGMEVGARESNTSGIEFVARLPAREDLSFPDDPYAELFAAAREHLATLRALPRRP